MTALLHIHLEPAFRLARRRGTKPPLFRSREAFFREHDPSDREPESPADLAWLIPELHEEQSQQGASYAEVRFSPRRFSAGDHVLGHVLEAASRAALPLSRPVIRLILLVNRNSPPGFIDACRREIAAGLPPAFIGLDLAGDERRFPDVTRFQGLFREARAAHLGITVHAGEFGPERNIWRALDELGAQRVGHAVAAVGRRALATRLAADGIVVEAAIGSNVALHAVRTLADHPLPWLMDQRVPVCLNTDVPLHVGTDLRSEWELAGRLVGWDQETTSTLLETAELGAFKPGGSEHGARAS
jgi:adenosine deaminase